MNYITNWSATAILGNAICTNLRNGAKLDAGHVNWVCKDILFSTFNAGPEICGQQHPFQTIFHLISEMSQTFTYGMPQAPTVFRRIGVLCSRQKNNIIMQKNKTNRNLNEFAPYQTVLFSRIVRRSHTKMCLTFAQTMRITISNILTHVGRKTRARIFSVYYTRDHSRSLYVSGCCCRCSTCAFSIFRLLMLVVFLPISYPKLFLSHSPQYPIHNV